MSPIIFKSIAMFKVLLFIFLPLSILGQNRFSIGVSINAQMSVMNIVEKNTEDSPFDDSTERGGVGWGYKVGLQFQYDFKKKSALRLGVNYQKQRHIQVINGAINTVNPDPDFVFRRQLKISSIGIPLDYIYYFRNDKKKMNFLLGVNGTLHLNLKNFFSGVVLKGEMYEAHILDDSPYSFGILGGVDISFSDHFSLSLEPNITYIPNKFVLGNKMSVARTAFESGLTLRVRFK